LPHHVESRRPLGLRLGVVLLRCLGRDLRREHLDLIVEDLEKATTEIESLGGRWLEPGNTRELEGFRWRIMADPEGNEFDIDVLPLE